MTAGGVDLAPADPPAGGSAARDGRRQAAAGRCAEVGFDTQGVDQGSVVHRVLGHLHTQGRGPGFAVLQTGVLQVLHHQDQGGGRFSLGDGADGFARLGQVGAATAQGLGHGQGHQAVLVQQFEIVVGEGAAFVVKMRGGGQLAADAFQQRFEIGRCHRAQQRRLLRRKTHGRCTRSK